ncbi:unnamed protein product [Mesocestoides corti]|uniref:RRM domain-containing protein n=1 Tax=Mesocestoides corti TaxID=53468 RepID=A0A158QS17_MESCO|nr:unnamed protein product [Mesocestoides corti]
MGSWYPHVSDWGFYDPIKSGSIDGSVGDDIPPHDRAVCRAKVAQYRPTEGAFPELVFNLWKDEDPSSVSDAKLLHAVLKDRASVDRTLCIVANLFLWSASKLLLRCCFLFLCRGAHPMLPTIPLAFPPHQVSLFIGRLHPKVECDELRSALFRLLREVKEERRSRRHRRSKRPRSRSPFADTGSESRDHVASLWPLVRIIKDPITGESRRYAFAWFKSAKDTQRVLMAWRESNAFWKQPSGDRRTRIDLSRIFGDMAGWEQMILEPSFSRSLPGWKPRRLGGGLGGRKESGQLRFGGIARLFRRPFRSFSDQDA